MADKTFKEWSQESGVTRTNAQAIIADPDDTEVLEYGGAILQLFMKRITKTKPPVWVVVVAEQFPNKDPELSMVFKVYETFAPNMENMRPADLLRLFTERFGCWIRLGSSRKKLYLGETVVLPEDKKGKIDFFEIEPPNGYGAEVVGVAHVKVRSGPPAQAVCSLFLAGNLTEYRAYLRNERKN